MHPKGSPKRNASKKEYLDLAGNKQVLHSGAVTVIQAGMVQPYAKLQAVAQAGVLHTALSHRQTLAMLCMSPIWRFFDDVSLQGSHRIRI